MAAIVIMYIRTVTAKKDYGGKFMVGISRAETRRRVLEAVGTGPIIAEDVISKLRFLENVF